ncbi:hypothetical protein B1F85_05220 [Pseudomonas syringae pv. actinidiae]|nr:hypothetical protein B1R35_05220 [Pseudomonas syringae pv. actinidiae]AQX63516.1 hypothetical protein B1F85_05220 [Pseudomonas syringae pv. actinidiae]
MACFGAASQPSRTSEASPGPLLLPIFCRSGLVRELPGTGSKTGALGPPDTAELDHFGAALSPSLHHAEFNPRGLAAFVQDA